ncbi:hypothetical protein PQ459_00275 [Chryseobacterium sp. KACC 21268]|nr:hypothetical protein PQ459_00275 [Chryseobacterium sp. KACC 21268]
MKLLVFLFLVLSFGFIKGQKIHSIYVLIKKEKFANHYKNYIERDSLVLYKDSTFRKENHYSGFDEIDKSILFGKWKFSKKSLQLIIQKREDSFRITMLNETQIINRSQLRKYKKSNQ